MNEEHIKPSKKDIIAIILAVFSIILPYAIAIFGVIGVFMFFFHLI